MLDDAEDVKSRINNSSKSMGALKFTWDEKDVPLETKIKLCISVPMNLLSWGEGNWSGNKDDARMIKIFQNKAMRHTLRINMTKVKDEETTNDEIRRRFGNFPKVMGVWKIDKCYLQAE